MNSKFCGKCGATNDDRTNFCMQCGGSLEIAAPQADNYGQTPAAAPIQWQQSPKYVPQADNFSSPQPGFTPPTPNSGAPSSFTPPNAGFQSPSLPQTYSSSSADTYKVGIGSKILSGIGAVIVVLFTILKFGVIFLRAGSFGGIWLVGIVLVIIAVVTVFTLGRRGRR